MMSAELIVSERWIGRWWGKGVEIVRISCVLERSPILKDPLRRCYSIKVAGNRWLSPGARDSTEGMR